MDYPANADALPPGSVNIDLRVHVMTRNDGTGGVSPRRIIRQVNVLNRGFSGQSNPAHSPDTPRRGSLVAHADGTETLKRGADGSAQNLCPILR